MKQQNQTNRSILSNSKIADLRPQYLVKQYEGNRNQSKMYQRQSVLLNRQSKSMSVMSRQGRDSRSLFEQNYKQVQRNKTRNSLSKTERVISIQNKVSKESKSNHKSNDIKNSSTKTKVRATEIDPCVGFGINYLLKKVQKPLKSSQSNKLFDAAMKMISESVSESKVYERLSVYSKQTNRSSLRMYKEDFQKMITLRYGKDRVTQFLDMEYIEDYSSITRTLGSLVKMSQEEVNILSFLIMDQNRDGLITPSDLMSFAGVKIENTETNFLLMEDLRDIVDFIKGKSERNENIFDTLSEQYQFLLDQGLTLMKLRVLNFQKSKKLRELESMRRRSKLRCTRPYQMFYTLKTYNPHCSQEKTSNSRTEFFVDLILRNRGRIISYENRLSQVSFALNFESFVSIFQNKIPRTFYDFLYVLSGIEVPHIVYPPIDSSVLVKTGSPKVEVKKQSNMEKIRQAIARMKSLSSETTLIYTLVSESSVATLS